MSRKRNYRCLLIFRYFYDFINAEYQRPCDPSTNMLGYLFLSIFNLKSIYQFKMQIMRYVMRSYLSIYIFNLLVSEIQNYCLYNCSNTVTYQLRHTVKYCSHIVKYCSNTVIYYLDTALLHNLNFLKILINLHRLLLGFKNRRIN